MDRHSSAAAPYVGRIRFCFTREPEFDSSFEPLGAVDLTQLPAIGAFVRDSLRAQLIASAVWPNWVETDWREYLCRRRRRRRRRRCTTSEVANICVKPFRGFLFTMTPFHTRTVFAPSQLTAASALRPTAAAALPLGAAASRRRRRGRSA